MLEFAALPKCGIADSRTPQSEELLHAIAHAAHLLPSQGPITVFVHHNTLHALEQLPFHEALSEGSRIYGSEAYLSEERYRRELARGRIRQDDLVAALTEDLGDRADELIGFLGTRFHFQLAMLQYPLLSGPSAELQWVVAETEALEKFRADAPRDVRRRLVEDTRRWVMRNCREDGAALNQAGPDEPARTAAAELIGSYSIATIEHWNESAWETFTLQLLWRICTAGVQDGRRRAKPLADGLRHRDLLLAACGEDSDAMVHETLVRFMSAALDQGFAPWSLPGKEEGLYAAFLDLYGQPGLASARWMVDLKSELERLKANRIGPLASIAESLADLGIADDERDSFIAVTLLALPGWSGMVWQMETNAQWAARPAPEGSLAEFLAVRLLLERAALQHLAAEELGLRVPLASLRSVLIERRPRPVDDRPVQRAFKAFQLAQLLGWTPDFLQNLSAETWRQLTDELDDFQTIDRRRVFHRAYERNYRNQALDAIASHARKHPESVGPPPKCTAFQLICCIDEREESFRRHVEEITPGVETFGAPGFFAVAMYYRGAADAHYIPLCPVVIQPRHYVRESAGYAYEDLQRRRAEARRTLGRLTHRVHLGSRTLLGGAVTALVGSLASIPLVARVLFPRLTAKFRQLAGRFVETPSATQLHIERSAPEPGSDNGSIGFSVAEMADAVGRILGDCGLAGRCARLVVVMGHGSSSLNNPHEAAHDCGACGGARGGPNARAFAQMANDPRVRAILNQRGFAIPDDTRFLGAYHNTCDDAVVYFDLERLPLSFRTQFEEMRRTIDQARERNAHERCRRFESAALDITPEAALRHVEGRAEDLAQVRPEYGHATNAMTVVGRRTRTRGMFMDRRAFFNSYDPTTDDEQSTILARILAAAIPVCAGISLEYYFSVVDPLRYGCGTKLPHNITSLLGVMDGAASDLRPGLPWQMVEIHEPVRNLFVIETTPERMLKIIDANPVIAQLCYNDWVQLAVLSPESDAIQLLRGGKFEHYEPTSRSDLPEVLHSADWYRGWRDHLAFAAIRSRAPDSKTELVEVGQREAWS